MNLIGNLGNGMPVAGNRVNISSPGRSSNVIWFASSQSPYFSDVDLTTGRPASPIRLPYTPNSMVMDEAGDTLYFGSYHELMTYSTLTNTLNKEVPGVPGVVLAVSPTGSTAIVNDQLRQVIYLYNTTSGTFSSIGGIAFRAQYSPDGTTVYIVGQDPATGQNTLFVNNTGTGWSSYPLSNQPALQLRAGGGGDGGGARLQPGVGSLLRSRADDHGAQRGDVPERELDSGAQLLPEHELPPRRIIRRLGMWA